MNTINTFKELFEDNIDLYNLKRKDTKIKKDKDTNKNIAEWVYEVPLELIFERDESNIPDDMRKEIIKIAESVGLTAMDDLYAVWSSLPDKLTDKLLRYVQAFGFTVDGLELDKNGRR